MATALDDVRVEVAFSADPNTTSPAFVDLTSRARMDAGISITRGRSEDFDDVQVGQCSLTLDNTDGALTAGLASTLTRTNRFTNPALTTALTSWSAAYGTGTGTVLRSTVSPPTINGEALAGYAQQTWTTSPGALNSTGILVGSPSTDVLPLTPGLPHTFSVYARSSVANRTVALTITSHDAAGGNQVIEVTTAATAIGGSSWVRLTGTFTPGGGQVRGFVRIYASGGTLWAPGDTMDATAAMLEVGSSATPYFSGAMPAAGSLTYQWTGGAGASSSQERTATPYYPNVKPQNRLRVTYRDAATPVNLLADKALGFATPASSDFNSLDVGAWLPGGSVLPALTNSTVRAWQGSRSMLITWGAGGLFPQAAINIPVVTGRTYTATAYVWVPAGNPPVQLVAAVIGVFGAASTTTGAWERISVTFTATAALAGSINLQIWPTVAPTAGQQAWVDAVMLDEGNAVRAYTNTSVVTYRFDGYIDKWPTEWPGGGETEAWAQISAYDLQARINRTRKLQSVIAETIRFKGAKVYFPLDEDSDSTSVGDRIGAGSTLAPLQVGTGGTLAFAGSTGPATDGAAAPLFTPASAGNGLYLSGDVPVNNNDLFFASGMVLQATVRTSVTTRAMTAAKWTDAYGSGLILGFDSAGHATVTMWNAFMPFIGLTVTSTQVYADNKTHVLSGEMVVTSGGVWNLYLYVDSVSRGTPLAATIGNGVPGLSTMNVGGQYGVADLFDGTISHVAGFLTTWAAADRTELYQAQTTGFAGERSDQRIARIAKWLGIPTALQNLDVGVSTIAHVDCTGKGVWEYMQDVTTTEAGLLFIGVDGKLTFYARSRSYDTSAPVDVTLPAPVVAPDVQIATDITDVVNDVTVNRAGGAKVRAFDAASQSAYGIVEDTLEIISNTDVDAFNRANWILGLKSQPMPRLPQLTIDALAEPNTAAAARQLDLSKRVALTGMPAQAPASTFDLRVQGYSETISSSGWDLVANTTPFLLVPPMIADDPVYGKADSNNRAVY